MLVLFLFCSVALAFFTLFFRTLFVPKRMHAGYSRTIEAVIVNAIRICFLALLGLGGYLVLLATGFIT